MTAPHGFDLEQAACELLRRSTEAQGLPSHVEDPATLRRIAAVLRSADHVTKDAA